MRIARLRLGVVLALAGLVVLATPLGARAADGDDDEVDIRVERSCTGPSKVRLRVRTRDDDLLRVDIDVRTTRRGTAWTVVTIHERRLVSRTQPVTAMKRSSD